MRAVHSPSRSAASSGVLGNGSSYPKGFLGGRRPTATGSTARYRHNSSIESSLTPRQSKTARAELCAVFQICTSDELRAADFREFRRESDLRYTARASFFLSRLRDRRCCPCLRRKDSRSGPGHAGRRHPGIEPLPVSRPGRRAAGRRRRPRSGASRSQHPDCGLTVRRLPPCR